ncbi:alpha/beta fold hydrolase [Bradyrhizobium sp. U87765 SZCCT0131]|uniref:alpha/beta hydrolase family protein n=1 Tax=unclassified Bradyrhizobium TaxID=2631580 RepID=UPI001BA820A8|nr:MULTISPECIES: alpha/beta fold hydrolase [unclassified Bradyrhizobium]MBR1222175.1 alpha/beta fold hydrolase [Bradyrhizobium sp. U87765 SZCCT0131]MBR1265696.1 alpha/beta fold hydrolase [Bradyrhizobium sp. U87765 SZCCT0134]MBR1307876.1 alpha/beta fold hydrolase [Bradyrhizobium sp. U87765 SZCCT0110]MBR1324014.1 alpha/beta fold hydrolase [Bradyrhizobium sp. U87765 SZCCT0109]MBR1348296.1 alpha/beta fold hydrolase [Bradyrhizobium sp. U87765 SZCCT0048]
MFFYFPGNYMWSLAVNRCLAAGGHFGEIHWALKDLQEAAKAPPQGDGEAWHRAWLRLARQTAGVGEQAEEKGHRATAASQFYRAAQYYQWAEAFLDPDDERAPLTYGLHLKSFSRFARHAAFPVEIVDVPFGTSSLSAYFVPARGVSGPAPAVILWDGLDGTKEEMFPMAALLAARGISCLGIDITGQGASLRLNGLKARHDSEVCAAAAVDWLEARADVDKARIGVIGASMGGYTAPRAVAYEKRIKACVAWGAIYDYHDVWVRRLTSIGHGAEVDYRNALGTTGKHLLNIMGARDFDDALALLAPFNLRDAAPRISCDILLVHGEDDRQTSLDNAKALFAAIGSSHKELRVYTAEEGGASHVQLDRQEPAASLIADWFSDHL